MKIIAIAIGIAFTGWVDAWAIDPAGSIFYRSVEEKIDSLTSNERPNVIIVLTDDQGYGDFSCHGNPVLKTPALDKLYEESIRFSNFHVTPLCTPTRGQLMTGMDAMHNKASTVGRGRGVMRRDLLTMPEVFRRNGYRTGLFGKWHLGHSYPDRPMDRGFQKSVWIRGWGLRSEIEFDNDYYQTRYLDSLETKYSNKYCTDLWFDEAINWMDEMSDQKQPFFTYLATNTPHGPFHAPEEDYNFYRNQLDERKTASFFGMIQNIDQNMERLDDWLEGKGIKDNTITIFLTDNGSAAGAQVYNAGMRGEKGSNYDGGHRAACFIRWSNERLGKARTVDYASQVQDLLPTLIDLLGFEVEKEYSFDGESLKPVLEQQDKFFNDRMFVVQFAGLDRPRKYYSSVVWDSWRLVGEDELYDLEKDPGQEHNVANDHPEVLNRMRNFYEDWWKGVEPELENYVPLIIGSKQNPVILTSDSWSGKSINTQWKVAQAEGDPKGGIWHIDVEMEGKYRLELSRWPFHLNRGLAMAGSEKSIGTTKFGAGKALPVQYGCIALNNNEPVIKITTADTTKITIDMDLNAGENRLQAWFKDKEGQDLCGAYFLRVERINPKIID